MYVCVRVNSLMCVPICCGHVHALTCEQFAEVREPFARQFGPLLSPSLIGWNILKAIFIIHNTQK